MRYAGWVGRFVGFSRLVRRGVEGRAPLDGLAGCRCFFFFV